MTNKPIFVAGPCVIESPELLNTVAEELVRLNEKYDIDIIFKASFDKANRTSIQDFTKAYQCYWISNKGLAYAY